jgi:hypothetical protein
VDPFATTARPPCFAAASPDLKPRDPSGFGWLNYWSAETARALGFPGSGADERWFAEARRSSIGGWILRLTRSPLDLDDPQHLER